MYDSQYRPYKYTPVEVFTHPVFAHCLTNELMKLIMIKRQDKNRLGNALKLMALAQKEKMEAEALIIKRKFHACA